MGGARRTAIRMALVEHMCLAKGRLLMGHIKRNAWTFGVTQPVGMVRSSSTALLVLLLVVTWPVAQYSHGNPHHEDNNSNPSHQTCWGA